MQTLHMLVMGLTIATLGIQSAFSQNNLPMPEGFRDLRLGMTRQAFLSTRTNAQPFELFSELSPRTNHISEMYMEEIQGHPFFEHTMYRLQSNLLDTVVFFGRIDDSEPNKGERFLNGLLSSWGEPAQSDVVELDEGKGSSMAPAAIWKNNGILIAAAFTPDARAKTTGNGSLQLKIQRDQEGRGSVLDKVFIVPSISQKEKEAILVPVHSVVTEWRMSQPKPENPVQPKQ